MANKLGMPTVPDELLHDYLHHGIWYKMKNTGNMYHKIKLKFLLLNQNDTWKP
jgi:hypothetical protein